MNIKAVLILGCGYVGEKLAVACLAAGLRVTVTTRSQERAKVLGQRGMKAVVVASPCDLSDELLASVDGLVDSIPLNRDGSQMLASQVEWVPQLAKRLPNLRWAGYLSTTGVYGDAEGAWVDEGDVCKPSSERGVQRLLAEQAWLASELPAEVFRLAGIYGAERNIVGKLKAGGYKAVRWDPPHFSSRIHVDDIVNTLMLAMHKPRAGRILNVADDVPLPHVDYVTELAALVGAEKPVVLSPEEGKMQLSAAMLSFFQDNKRVSNRRLHEELLPDLKYPSFRDALGSLL